MCVIGVTGHVDVPADRAPRVREMLTARVQELRTPGWQGITCLAKGADQMFAKVVLALQGRYDVVLPSRDYRQRMIEQGDGEQFCRLLARADHIRTLPFETSTREAYLEASRRMLDRCDVLLAVWDGRPSQRVGDTADVVAEAKRRDMAVVLVWPHDEAVVTPVAAQGQG
jgi:hypothetical protein